MEETVKLLEVGKVVGYEQEMPEVISTGSSHVFIFRKNNVALKLYRRDNEHWNKYFTDMSEGEARKSFIGSDYEWNNFYSPNVYLGLKQIDVKDGYIELSSPKGGDELIIEMKIVDDASFLMNFLNKEEEISEETFISIGKQIAEITKTNNLKSSTSQNFYDISKQRVLDLMNWIKSLNSFSNEFLALLENYLNEYVESHRADFQKLIDKDFVTVIDCHSANAVYENGKISFVDVLLPKEIWRVSRINENFFRTGADIAVLRGKDSYEAYRAGFMEVMPFENNTEEFDLIYCASLMLCAQTAYAKKDKEHQPIADKYYKFINDRLNSI